MQPVAQREHHRAERQEIDPPAAPREKRLLHFEAKHAADLAHPEIHIVLPSPPIRYWYTEFTSSSAGATDSTTRPDSSTMRFSSR